MASTGYSYVGLKPCGCMGGAVSEDPDRKPQVGKQINDFIRRGWTVERKPSTYILDHLTEHCPECAPNRHLMPQESRE